jgi:pimeloyl-ACP methyl ester carboxylesterase
MYSKKIITLSVCIAMFLSLNVTEAKMQIDYFQLAGGQRAFILNPSQPAAGSPWVWYAPTIFGATPDQSNDWIFQGLLDSGIAVAGVDVGESYGSPAGRSVYSDFYDYATTQANLAPQACLLAQSRGGLMLYNWAAENPEKVSSIAGIYPVCDLRSYPGLPSAAPAYDMTVAELEAQLSNHNPIDRLAPLAAANIPIYHIHGDSDVVVPLMYNSQIVYDRYIALGGQMELVVVIDKGHQWAPEFFESQDMLNFMKANVYVPEPATLALLGIGGVLCATRKKSRQ